MNITSVYSFIFSLLHLVGESSLETTLFFESLESKTATGAAVFNSIELQQQDNKDIWLMKQSHFGAHSEEWDEVKIVVHKNVRPFKASYHQLKDDKEIEYKTSCFRCHSGGPRLIRPNINSPVGMLSLKERLVLLKMNSLIKSYGEVLVGENNPFKRSVTLVDNPLHSAQQLKVKSCLECHRAGGSRAALTKENVLTIEFLVQQKQMPPWPHTLSASERAELQKFIYGL